MCVMEVQALRLFHTALRKLGYGEELKRLILRNVGGVESSKDLDLIAFEDVMATLEDAGFRHQGKPETYWRDIVARRGSFCGSRMEFRIRELAAQQPYDLEGLCRRFSQDRVSRVDKLTPQEGHTLLTALNHIVSRPTAGATGVDLRAKAAGGGAAGYSAAGTASGMFPEAAGGKGFGREGVEKFPVQGGHGVSRPGFPAESGVA
jgi:hypothetical protein